MPSYRNFRRSRTLPVVWIALCLLSLLSGCATPTQTNVDRPAVRCGLVPLPDGAATPRQIGDVLARQWREVEACNEANGR